MQLEDEKYRSFTPYRQQGVTEHPDYYARNAYWKPPDFKKGRIWIHVKTGVRFQKLMDESIKEHLNVGRNEEIYYIRIPSKLQGNIAREEIVSGPLPVKLLGRDTMMAVFTVTEFFLDNPRRKIGYVRVVSHNASKLG